MSEAQAVDLMVLLADVRRMVELAAWSVFIATGFVVMNTVHRLARGR